MNFLKTPQYNALYKQTIPMLIGLFTIMGSQLVDSVFIGQLGPKPLAVIGFSMPIYQLIIGIQVGIGIATTACISNALGANNKLYAKVLGTLVIVMGTIAMLVLCTVLWQSQQQLFSFLGAQASLFQLLHNYWLPWLTSCWLGAMLYFGYSICRSHGETIIPGRVMVITSLLNVILDPLFMFTLNLGLPGAAWATCVSFIIGSIIIFKAIIAKAFLTKISGFNQSIKGIKAIIEFSIPATLSQFIPPISAMIATILIASYGDFAIGAWGLANRIESISIILILALTMALPPMIGKLNGKNDPRAIFRLVKLAISIIVSFQLVLTLVILITANPVVNLLANQSEVKGILMNYLWLVPISYGALGVCMISVSACNAMRLPKSALMISILRLFGCYLPLIWIGSEFYGLIGVFIGATLGNFLSGMVGWSMFLRQYSKLKEQHDTKRIIIPRSSMKTYMAWHNN